MGEECNELNGYILFFEISTLIKLPSEVKNSPTLPNILHFHLQKILNKIFVKKNKTNIFLTDKDKINAWKIADARNQQKQ